MTGADASGGSILRFTAGQDRPPGAAERAAYDANGFLVLEGFTGAAMCARLRARAEALVDAFEPAATPTLFSTTTQAHARDEYFLGSGGAVRFFLEEEAVDDTGALRVPKARAVNKIGHALHDLDPVFSAFSRSAALAAVARVLGVAEPLLLQSMYIFKQPGIGGEVVWHQDATFLYTRPPSVLGLWVALEDATIDNGCLWALPGGHRGGLRSRFRRVGDTMSTETLDPTPFDDRDAVPLEVPAGALVALHGLLPHWSGPNRSGRSRHAYSLHVIEAGAAYPADNWLQRDATLALRGFDQPRGDPTP